MATSDMVMQNNDYNTKFGYNQFQPGQFKIQNFGQNGHDNNAMYLAARPIKVIPVMTQNGNMGNYMIGDNKLIVKATPVQQIIQIPLHMLRQSNIQQSFGQSLQPSFQPNFSSNFPHNNGY
jgi:hypothetical protein